MYGLGVLLTTRQNAETDTAAESGAVVSKHIYYCCTVVHRGKKTNNIERNEIYVPTIENWAGLKAKKKKQKERERATTNECSSGYIGKKQMRRKLQKNT